MMTSTHNSGSIKPLIITGIVCLVAGVGIGFLAGGSIATANYEKTVMEPLRQIKGDEALLRLTELCMLRLGETERAIEVGDSLLISEANSAFAHLEDGATISSRHQMIVNALTQYWEKFPPKDEQAIRPVTRFATEYNPSSPDKTPAPIAKLLSM